jgi:hypothetical protein
VTLPTRSFSRRAIAEPADEIDRGGITAFPGITSFPPSRHLILSVIVGLCGGRSSVRDDWAAIPSQGCMSLAARHCPIGRCAKAERRHCGPSTSRQTHHEPSGRIRVRGVPPTSFLARLSEQIAKEPIPEPWAFRTHLPRCPGMPATPACRTEAPNPDYSTPELVEEREQVQGAGCMRLACVARCVLGEATCVPEMAAGRGWIAGVGGGRFRLRRREMQVTRRPTGPPCAHRGRVDFNMSENCDTTLT